jgi:hypothetical protein
VSDLATPFIPAPALGNMYDNLHPNSNLYEPMAEKISQFLLVA